MSESMSRNDMQRFGKVAVLMGGLSAEREISLKSGVAVLKALLAQGVDAHKIDADYQTLSMLQNNGFDRVFNVLHGRWGEDGVMQGALEAVKLPYTGSGVLASALAMDKVKTKQVWQACGLPTAKYRVLNSEKDLTGLLDALGLPVFLKPAREGSSIGICKVETEFDLQEAWQTASQHGDAVLAEQFISGDELTVAILNGKALPIIKLQTNNAFYDYEAKYQSEDTQYLCPAGLSDEQETAIAQLALEAFDAIGCKGWGRVDIMLDANQQPQLLEVNTVPGMTDHSLVPMAAAQNGISFEQLVIQVLESSCG